MKQSKIPSKLQKSASALHKAVGEVLTSSKVFENFEIRQEYRVSAINPSFPSNREKFDWVILGVKVVIECHGKQHTVPARFGGISQEEAERKLRQTQDRDYEKQKAAEEAGWTYIIVQYNEEVTEELVTERIKEAMAAQIIERTFKKLETLVAAKPKAKIPSPKKYNWPKGRKIPGRKFNGEPRTRR